MPEKTHLIKLICDVKGLRADVYVAEALGKQAPASSDEAEDAQGPELYGEYDADDECCDEAPGTLPDDPDITSLTRSGVRKLIDKGLVKVNGLVCKANYRTSIGDEFAVEIPEPELLDVEPQDIPLDIVYEDRDIIVINKQRGMVVHPAPGNTSGTLVNALLFHCKDLSDINGTVRPGIVHRIDRDTTGLICVAKNNAAHNSLAAQLKTHSMARVYIALTEGSPGSWEGTVDSPIGRHPVDRKKMAAGVKNGRAAVTHYEIIEKKSGFALLRVKLETGRTHQIRVHMASLGCPIVGDPLYGIKNNRGQKGQLLHAGRLTLTHPSTSETMVFRAPLPDDFAAFLAKNGFESLNMAEDIL